MEWSGRLQDTGSGVSQKARPQQAEAAVRFYCTAGDSFQHTQNPHSPARIDRRAARAARNTLYRYNQIGPQDHKMADNCVSLARTNTVSSTITKLIVTECIHVPGHDPLIFSFRSFSFLTGWELYGPNYLRC